MKQWRPVCPGPMLPEFGPNNVRNYFFDQTHNRNQWADIHTAPTLTALSVFCADRQRGADCVCVYVGNGDVILDCSGYPHDYPAHEHCMRSCECGVGPLGRRLHGPLRPVIMEGGRTTIHVNPTS